MDVVDGMENRPEPLVLTRGAPCCGYVSHRNVKEIVVPVSLRLGYSAPVQRRIAAYVHHEQQAEDGCRPSKQLPPRCSLSLYHSEASRHDLRRDLPVHVRQPVVATAVAEGQLLVVQPHQVQQSCVEVVCVQPPFDPA
jgi:hypothetical protein